MYYFLKKNNKENKTELLLLVSREQFYEDFVCKWECFPIFFIKNS